VNNLEEVEIKLTVTKKMKLSREEFVAYVEADDSQKLNFFLTSIEQKWDKSPIVATKWEIYE
jgi:hypothetical protein